MPRSHKAFVSDPLITRPAPRGRPADRIAAGVALVALVLSALGTLWFFLGFFENDPEFRASSSAFLLSLGLGAFAIIPSAVVMRLAWAAYRRGFSLAYGLWGLVLMAPWVVLGFILLRRSPLPWWGPAVALLLSALLCLWAIISLVLEWRERRVPGTAGAPRA